jgi:hypothetical protein
MPAFPPYRLPSSGSSCTSRSPPSRSVVTTTPAHEHESVSVFQHAFLQSCLANLTDSFRKSLARVCSSMIVFPGSDATSFTIGNSLVPCGQSIRRFNRSLQPDLRSGNSGYDRRETHGCVGTVSFEIGQRLHVILFSGRRLCGRGRSLTARRHKKRSQRKGNSAKEFLVRASFQQWHISIQKRIDAYPRLCLMMSTTELRG